MRSVLLINLAIFKFLAHTVQIFLGFPQFPQYVFSLVSSHPNFAMSVGTCAIMDIGLRKYFGDPLTIEYPFMGLFGVLFGECVMKIFF